MYKLSNFEVIKVNKGIRTMATIDWNALARVDVTTGMFFKKTKTREIYRKLGEGWFFTDNGEDVPKCIYKLVKVYEAKNGEIFQWL